MGLDLQWFCECSADGMDYVEFARHVRGCVTNYEVPIVIEFVEN